MLERFPRFHRFKRRLAERLGIERWAWPGLRGLDKLIYGFLRRHPGYFVEAGAFDGYEQSNTYALESLYGWTGILIEPVPGYAASCRLNRPRSRVVEAALVGPDHSSPHVLIEVAGLMSISTENCMPSASLRDHAAARRRFWPSPTLTMHQAKACTLTQVLDAAGAPADFDLLVLDLEGAEYAALRGMDFTRYHPRLITVECWQQTSPPLPEGTYDLVLELPAGKERRDCIYARRP